MPLVITAHPNAEDTRRSHEQTSPLSSEILAAEAQLARHLRGRLWDVRIKVHRDSVVLQGQASSYYVKQLAQHVVMSIVLLPITANEIEVAPLTGGRRQ